MKIRFNLLLWPAIFLVTSCVPNRIEGTVLDVKGEALPGVVVTAEETGNQALTNTLGRYKVPYQPGTVILTFFKTGYTPGRLELDIDRFRPVQARPVRLWPLPPQKGVYLYENHRYRSITPVMPDRFEQPDGTVLYGTTKWADVETYDTARLVLCHKMPPYGVRVHRMDLIELAVEQAEGSTETTEVWAPARPIPVEVVPIDQVEALLTELRFDASLEPGFYAVDWGALSGDASRDKHMFFFGIVNPPAYKPLKED